MYILVIIIISITVRRIMSLSYNFQCEIGNIDEFKFYVNQIGDMRYSENVRCVAQKPAILFEKRDDSVRKQSLFIVPCSRQVGQVIKRIR